MGSLLANKYIRKNMEPRSTDALEAQERQHSMTLSTSEQSLRLRSSYRCLKWPETSMSSKPERHRYFPNQQGASSGCEYNLHAIEKSLVKREKHVTAYKQGILYKGICRKGKEFVEHRILKYSSIAM